MERWDESRGEWDGLRRGCAGPFFCFNLFSILLPIFDYPIKLQTNDVFTHSISFWYCHIFVVFMIFLFEISENMAFI